jgi:hypothetical protein
MAKSKRSAGGKSGSQSGSQSGGKSAAGAKGGAKTAAKRAAGGKATAAKGLGGTTKSAGRAARSGAKSGGASAKRGGKGGGGSNVTTDHDQIRQWAEARGGRPACVRGTGGGGNVGMIRLDFPGFSGEDSLQEISWEEWFRAFDENNLALVFQEETGGQQSNFNKLVSRDNPKAKGGASKSSRSGDSKSGSRRGQ